MELLDIVNDLDEVIGIEERNTCHENDILHRSSNIIVFNESRDKILIQKRSKHKKNKPNIYCFVGGHVDSGESYYDAALREFSEEMLDGTLVNLELKELFKLKKLPIMIKSLPQFMRQFMKVTL